MDQKLVAWARAVKRRYPASMLPPLWLITDSQRLADVEALVGQLPPRLSGVILRGDLPGHDRIIRAQQAVRIALICRRRHVALSVAGDLALPMQLRAGRHLRGGRVGRGRYSFLTSSAHDLAELHRAQRAGAALILLSPMFATASHPYGKPLGPLRGARLAGRAPLSTGALGGISGCNVRQLPNWCRHVAGLSAFLA